MYVNGLNGYWLVVGAKNKQQWGYGTAGTITYPIQFTEIAYTAFACDIAESNQTIVSVATNPPEINQIVVRPSAAQTITWLVIGKQQWGTADGTRGNFTTNLNVPYLNFYLPYASSTNTYGTDIWTVSARVETDLSKIGLSSEGNFEIIWLAIGM